MTALVTEHLPLVSGAPDGIKKLRSLILELAVRGKLVPHDRCESPVGDLLARISLARNSSSTKGKVRKDAPIEQGLEPRFDAPTGWQWVRLGDLLTKIGAGSTPLGGKQAYVASGVKFLRSQNVWNEGLRLDEVALISEETHQKMSGTHVEAGDILFNITGASIGRCAIVPDSFDTGNVSQHVTIIRPCIPDICTYLHKVLMSGLVQDTVMAVQVGVSREGLSIGKLAQFPIPLPPLDEQHRIVAKVDELMALCDRLEADQADAEAAHAQLVQALLNSLTHTTDAADFRASWQRLSEHFHTLFTTEASIDALKHSIFALGVSGALAQKDPGTFPLAAGHPVGWREELVGNVGEIKLGRQRSPKDHYGPNMVPYLRVANVHEAKIDTSDVKQMNFSLAEQEVFRLRVGDILLNEGQSRELVGRPAIYRGEVPGACFQNTLLRYRCGPDVLPEYALLYFRSCMHSGRFQRAAQQTTNIAHLSASRLAAIEIVLPPLSEQHRIVAKVDELMALCDQLKSQLAEARQQHAQLATALVAQAVA